MRRWSSWIGWLVFATAVSSAIAQIPVLSTLQTPYPALQSQIKLAGNTYGPGMVAYGPAGTPLILSGSGLGDRGAVWFISYKNRAVDPNSPPIQAVVASWTPNQVYFYVPSGAVTGLVEVVVGDKTSNGLPFLVTRGTYSGTCPAGPSASQLRVATNSLQDGAVNQSYSTQLQAAGGSGSYSWLLASGSLPAGLSLSSSGVISGTPTSASSPVSFTVQATDTSSQQEAAATLSLEISAQPEAPSNSTLYNFAIQTTSGSKGYDSVGNVIGYTDSVNGSWSFTYDSLRRLATASGSQDDNPYPNYCWQYDSFGNRLWQTSSATTYSGSNGGANSCPAGSGPSWWAQYNSTNTNRMDSTSLNANQSQYYDSSGNISYDGANSYLYDGEGRICAVQQSVAGLTTMMQYLYDAEGRRVAKGTISNFSCDTTSNGFTATSVYVLGPSGEQMTEMVAGSGGWQWAHTNISAAGQQIATYDADPTGATEGSLYFHLSDWLDTRRQQTDYAGNPVLNFTSLPYGDGLNSIPVSTAAAADATEHHFTGKERDAESGNDYFGARYYSSTMGRWMSPDWSKLPIAIPYADINNPQSLNLYSYVKNNPLTHADADGHMQLCGQQTSSTNANGDTVVSANCVDLPDPPTLGQTVQTWWKQTVVDPWNARIASHAAPQQPNDNISVEDIAKMMMVLGGAGRISSKYDTSITNKGSVKNVDTDVSVKEAGENLEANGYTKSTASDGTPTYTKGDTQYTIYSKASSTGGPTAQVKVSGEVVAKIRLQP